jgi:predicted dehydrogenase
MSVKGPLRIAVVGCGRIVQWHHIPSLFKIKDAKLMAICDQGEDLVREVASRFSIRRYYTDFAEMLSR